MQSIKRVQTDYEKRLKDVESQREQLLSEMESRESTLISRVSPFTSSNTCTQTELCSSILYHCFTVQSASLPLATLVQ